MIYIFWFSVARELLSSEISQDPDMMSIVQQQYLLSRLQLHSQALPSQLAPLDKILLLKQQQKQGQQQIVIASASASASVAFSDPTGAAVYLKYRGNILWTFKVPLSSM